MAGKQGAMRIFYKFDGVLRTSHHYDEARRLLKGPPLPFLLFQPLALGERSPGYFLADAEKTHNVALFVPNGRVGIGEMRLFEPSAPIQGDREILLVDRL